MISSYLIQSLGDPFNFVRGFRLCEKDGYAVYQKNDVWSDGLAAIRKRKLIGHMKCISIDILSVDEPHVPLPLLIRDEDRFKTSEVLPCNQIALYTWRDSLKSLDQLFCQKMIHKSGIEFLHLVYE